MPERAVNCLIWLSQILEQLCLINFKSCRNNFVWYNILQCEVNSRSSILALCLGDKSWFPSIAEKKLVWIWIIWGWKVCKLSSLNAPGIATLLPILFWEEYTFQSLIIFRRSHSKLIQVWIFFQIQTWIRFEWEFGIFSYWSLIHSWNLDKGKIGCPRHWNTSVSSIYKLWK